MPRRESQFLVEEVLSLLELAVEFGLGEVSAGALDIPDQKSQYAVAHALFLAGKKAETLLLKHDIKDLSTPLTEIRRFQQEETSDYFQLHYELLGSALENEVPEFIGLFRKYLSAD